MHTGPATSRAPRPAASQSRTASEAKLVAVAVIVAFDPLRDPRRAVAVTGRHARHVIVVDNAPGGHPALESAVAGANATVLRHGNRHGLAGAYNAALDWIAAHLPDATHVLFLDDDSDPQSVEALLDAPQTAALFRDENVAAVAPVYRERATGLRGAHIQLRSWSYRFLARELHEPTPVTFLINSMSLWRLSALRKIGPYCETLAVDHIDTDVCLRAKLLGYTLVLNPQIEFWHSIGSRRSYKLLGKTVQTGGHDATRRRQIAKNTVLLAKRYLFHFPAFSLLCLMRLCYEVLGICAAEEDKRRKLRGLAAGAIAGLFARSKRPG